MPFWACYAVKLLQEALKLHFGTILIILSPIRTFVDPLGGLWRPFGGNFGPFGGHLDPLGGHFDPFWSLFSPLEAPLNHFEPILPTYFAPILSHLDLILSYWRPFEPI